MKYLIMQPWISYRGAETMSVCLTQELNKHGEVAKLLGLFVEKQYVVSTQLILPSKNLQKLFKSNKLILYSLGTPYLIYLILKNINKFDILIPYNLPTSWLAAVFGKIFAKPVIWMSQGIPEKDGSLLWTIASSRIDIFLTKLIDKIISPSNFLAKKLKSRYGKDALVIHNPIVKISGSVKDNPQEVKDLRQSNKFVFLLVGALNKQKRQLEILEIFQKVLKVEPSCALILVGEGEDKKNLESRIWDLKLHNNVYLAGYVPKEKLGGYYQICDLNLLPSIKETFGATPLEALMFGKNSLITTDSGIVELIHEFGIISRPQKNELFKNIIGYIKNKKYFDEKAKKYKNIIIKKLTWEKYYKTFKKFIDIDPIDTYKKSYYEAHYHNAPNDLLVEREVRKDRAMEYLNIQKGDKVLDLGVGEGDLALLMSKKGAKVWGIDYSSDAINLAKKKCGKKIELFEMDASKLNFPDNYFDKIVTIDVFEHIYQKKLDKVLQEIKRVIKPNGLLIVETSPNSFFWLPIMFLGKLIFGMGQLESEKYHINIFNYFRLKNLLGEVSDDVTVTLHNDGKNFLSSRVIGSNLSGKSKLKRIIHKVLRFIDFVFENKLFSSNIFFGHDLWAVVHINKKR